MISGYPRSASKFHPLIWDLFKQDQTIEILYQDSNIIALNKQPGISTIPPRNQGPSVLKDLAAIFGKLYVVHRLDKEASGVLVFARDPSTHRFLCQQFEQRRVLKEYLCVVRGEVSWKEKEVELPIRQYGSGRMGVDFSRGKPSYTKFLNIKAAQDHSVIIAHPITGRRHQIRVHLYSIGHPILGDPIYGAKANREGALVPRLMLHSLRITLWHPDKGRLEIRCPIPGEFQPYLGGKDLVSPL